MTDLAARIDWGLIPAVPVPFRGDAIAADAQHDYARWLARQGVAGGAVWAPTGRGPPPTPAPRPGLLGPRPPAVPHPGIVCGAAAPGAGREAKGRGPDAPPR